MWDTETGQIIVKRTKLHFHYTALCTLNIKCCLLLQWTGFHDGMVTNCTYSNDGKLVASVTDLDNALTVWDAFSGEAVANVESKFRHQNRINQPKFVVKVTIMYSIRYFVFLSFIKTEG